MKYFTFPPVKDAAFGKAGKNTFISACCFKIFLAILGCDP